MALLISFFFSFFRYNSCKNISTRYLLNIKYKKAGLNFFDLLPRKDGTDLTEFWSLFSLSFIGYGLLLARGNYGDTFAAYWQPRESRITDVIVVAISRRSLLMALSQYVS